MCEYCDFQFALTERDADELKAAKAEFNALRDERDARRERLAALMASGDEAAATDLMASMAALDRHIAIARRRVAASRLPGLELRRGIYNSLIAMTAADLEATRRDLQSLAA
jgi:hypothetical protein